jgi:hypothetical protein
MTLMEHYPSAIMDFPINEVHEDGSITPVRYADGNYSILANIPDVFPGGSWKEMCSPFSPFKAPSVRKFMQRVVFPIPA